jgi:hypothetical protein
VSCAVFDLEANGLEDATQIWCISLKKDDQELLSWSKDVEEGFAYLGNSDEILGHNIIGYDLPLMEKLHGWVPEEETRITDTLVLSRLGNPDRPKPTGYTGKGGPHSLEAWGYRVCRAKPGHEDWSVYSPAMLERNREDVEINRLTADQLSREFEGHDWGESIAIEHDVFRIITEQARQGVVFNVRLAEQFVDHLTGRMDSIVETLRPRLPSTVKQRGVSVRRPFKNNGEYCQLVNNWYTDEFIDSPNLVGGEFSRIEFVPLDIGSIKQVKDYLLSEGWMPTQWNYNDDWEITSPKLTEDSFHTIQGDTGELVTERIVCAHRRSQIQGWLSRVREDGRLTAAANTCGTPTGRFRHINVVNVPKAAPNVFYGTQMRSLFTVPDWYLLVGHDAEQLELRLLAHYMGDKHFIEEIKHGDIHTANQRAAGLPTRDSAKTFIYAFNYGAGDAKLGSIVGGDKNDGAALRGKFYDSYPKLEQLINRVKRASSKGWLQGLDGRRLYMRKEDGRIQRKKALNTLLQGAGSVLMKKSMILLDDYKTEAQLDAKKVLDMHDEGQAEVFFTQAHQYGELACKSIVEAGKHFNLNIPMAAQYQVGKTWAATH